MAPTEPPDPAAVETRAQLAHGLMELFQRTGLSYDRVATQTGLSTSTVHGMCAGRSLPRAASLKLFVAACGGDPEAWAEALRRVKRGGTPSPAHRSPDADVTVRLRQWVKYYNRSPYAEDLLRGVPQQPAPDAAPAGLTGLPSVVGHLTNSLVTVQAVTEYHGLTVPVGSPERFWALVAADCVLQRFEGTRKWLVKETRVLVGEQDDKHLGQLRLVWQTLFDLLLRVDTLDRCGWPPRRIVQDVADATESRPQRRRRVMDWLLGTFPADGVVGQGLRRAWEQHRATSFPVLPTYGSRSFDPPVVPVGPVTVSTGRGETGYSFEAMRRPLTVGDLEILWRDRVAAGDDARLPYVLGRHPDERSASLGRFLHQLVGRCLLTTDHHLDQGWTWAVPTAAEWLALSGCAADDRPYPWGGEPPTPEHANLRFPGATGTARPVELLRAGRSPEGAFDCCGNVHEIVEWRLGGLRRSEPTLDDLRLAGGSFRNRPENASCHTFRRFVPSPGAPRQNVGIRLIRHRTEHTGLRMDALKQFHNGRARPRRTEDGRRPAADRRSLSGVDGLPGHGDRLQLRQPLV
ncbi:helix-turn-helix domain-containing protein [Streptomyces tibetensis]|uniref:Helix-turn-helix domain-containing protein n=1 Tax=Streptomyces tibetensis TaxID=2382123 RepID=A0ABW6MSZ1_9ACTN